MNTEIISNTFENGHRVQIQKVTYEKSDDLFTLANLQRQYENILRQIALAEGEGKDTSRYLADKAKMEEEIAEQETLLALFDSDEQEENTEPDAD